MTGTGLRTAAAGLLLGVSCVCCTDPEPPDALPDLLGEPPPVLEEGLAWRPERRFALPGGSNREVPAATLGSETRPALESPAPVTLNYAPAFAVPEDGRVSLRPPLPASHRDRDQVYLAIRVKPDDRWVSLPGRLADVVTERGRRRVRVDFDLIESAGREAGIWVRAFVPGASTHDTEAFRVPAQARLDFATGVLEPALAAGPVVFQVAACASPDEGAEACETLFRRRVDPAADPGFHDHSLGLGAWRGREIQLRFEAAAAEGGASLPVWADPVLRVPGPKDGRSLVLISLDTLRADHLGAYGYPRDTTPFLDELAERGVLFEQYVAASSSTRPSHMTMFTSLQPSVHGATENADVRALPAKATTLAELLRAAGVATAAVTEDGAIDRSRGFARGFDFYVENRDAQRADLRTGHIEQTFAQGLAWLEQNRDRRFFLFLHTYQVHNPFTPPPEYDRFFTGDPGDLAAPPELRSDWDPLLYDREIRYADDQVRELVAALAAGGRLEDTFLVVTSDHGEAFLEHGFVAHGASVHREVVNVPWIVTGPGVPAGLRLRNAVPMVDLMPTLLDLMGVAGTGAEMGRSQAPLVRGERREVRESERAIYSEAWAERAYRARGFDRIAQPTFALRLRGRKLVRAPRGDGAYHYELYDLAADPLERNDLHPTRPEEAADLKKILQRYDAAVTALHARLGESADEPLPAVPNDPDLEEKLRALGYLD